MFVECLHLGKDLRIEKIEKYFVIYLNDYKLECC